MFAICNKTKVNPETKLYLLNSFNICYALHVRDNQNNNISLTDNNNTSNIEHNTSTFTDHKKYYEKLNTAFHQIINKMFELSYAKSELLNFIKVISPILLNNLNHDFAKTIFIKPKVYDKSNQAFELNTFIYNFIDSYLTIDQQLQHNDLKLFQEDNLNFVYQRLAHRYAAIYKEDLSDCSTFKLSCISCIKTQSDTDIPEDIMLRNAQIIQLNLYLYDFSNKYTTNNNQLTIIKNINVYTFIHVLIEFIKTHDYYAVMMKPDLKEKILNIINILNPLKNKDNIKKLCEKCDEIVDAIEYKLGDILYYISPEETEQNLETLTNIFNFIDDAIQPIKKYFLDDEDTNNVVELINPEI